MMKISKYLFCLVCLIPGILGFSVNAQTKEDLTFTVTGIVKDASTGTPLPGVDITLPGISSAMTDDDGSFSINLPEKSVLLDVTAFGYASKQISVNGSSALEIFLYEAGYKGAYINVITPLGEMSSYRTTNAWETIQEDNTLSTAISPDALLQGYSTGVNTIYRSGIPGNGASMFLHGFNSLNAGTMPLFIIDGMPYENNSYSSSITEGYYNNPLTSIDVKDIESITVLKDGTSLYGIKGSNGVILIKTFRPATLETRINVQARFGVNFEPDQLPVLNAGQHKNLLSDLYASQGMLPQDFYALPFIDNTVPVSRPWGYEGNTDYYRYNHQTNWQDVVYNSSFNQNYYINVQGGDDIALYGLSLGFLDQQGTVENTSYQRFTTRFNSEIKLSQILNFRANMSFIYGRKDLMNEGGNTYLNPMLAALLKAPFMDPHVYDEEGVISPNQEDADVFGNSNPYTLSNSMMQDAINYRFFGSFGLDLKVRDDLYIHGLFGLNFNKERERLFYPGTGVAFETLPEGVVTNASAHRVSRLFALYGDIYAHYNFRPSVIHNLDASLGLRYQSNQGEEDWGKGYNAASDDFKSVNYGDANLRRIGGTAGDWNWASYYANVDYGLMDKYFFNASVSFDASSRYGKDAAYAYAYPSVSAAWLISGEDFMKNATVFDMLKLRLGYGLSGNDDIGNYSGIRYYTPQNLLGAYGLIRGNLVNTKLKPEKTEKLSVGVDASIVKERINLSVDLYSNTVKDMILFTSPNRLSGFDSYINNAGSMRNQGVDLNLNTRIINTLFKWDLGIRVSHYKNEVLELTGMNDNIMYTEILGATIQTKEGQALNKFWGYKTDGVYATQAEADEAGLYMMHGLQQAYFGAGDVRFVNLDNSNGNTIIDENDMTVIGDPNPDIYGAISNNFKYKEWGLDILMTYSLGNDVYNYTRAQMESMSTYNNQSEAVINRWKQPGDRTDIPKATYGDPMGNSRFSDRWIEDGSYLRLKSVTLSYDFNLNINFIENLSVFMTGENLLTFTKYKGLDPEFSMGQNPLYYGVDAGYLAQPRTLSLGVRIGL